jgi:hypothetical protein
MLNLGKKLILKKLPQHNTWAILRSLPKKVCLSEQQLFTRQQKIPTFRLGTQKNRASPVPGICIGFTFSALQ